MPSPRSHRQPRAPSPPAPIAVTGAAGFIGSHLSELLVTHGHPVLGLDSFEPFYGRALKEANLRPLTADPRFSLRCADVRDPGLARRLAGVGAICHLAGRPGVRGGDPAAFEQANVEVTRAVMHAAGEAGVRRVVLASSSSVYAPATGPTREGAPLGPPSDYGRSKRRAEEVAGSLAAAAGIELVVLRFFTVYGPRQRPDMAFARYIDCALGGGRMPLFGDGGQVRDFTYVGDAVAAVHAAIHHGRAGAVYNVAGGAPVPLGEALSLLGRALGRPAALVAAPGDPREHRSTWADLRRSARELGWRPRVRLADGLARQAAHALSRRAAAHPAAAHGRTPAQPAAALLEPV